MSKLTVLGAILLFLFAPGFGQPLLAQPAISEPGAFAFYHPNADVLNGGRPTARSFYPAYGAAYGYAPRPPAPFRYRRRW